MSKNLTKMHHVIIHTLPFVPSRKRQKGFEITRNYGKWSLHMKAFETLNYYDLITLLFLAKCYIEKKDCTDLGYSKDDGRRIVRISIDLEQLVIERGLHNERTNRHTVVSSLERLMTCQFTVIEETKRTAAWIIAAVQTDSDEKVAEVDCNAKFLEWCARGVLVNLHRLVKYKDNGVAVVVDSFLQGTKQRRQGVWMYREHVDEEKLFDLIDPHNTQKKFKLRQQLREAFALMEQHGMPRYTYNKTRRRFERSMTSSDEI